ncbi:hypothetical protein BJ878DRAFT_424284 [Calycina marina]|uniref:SWIM-type domain-containing protein n=1 Tax=Calycina marina TaxID=1763456 RepID=A0A9P8CDZ9_9HELO|nr:hypothetical protein BJ878DRAFT_424284 [Calycina marina]
MSLPTPRKLFTSLINTLTLSMPSPGSGDQQNQTNKGNDEGNAFKALSPAQKALLTTLHVIIPPPTLLQALDLLDRRLATRILCSPFSVASSQEKEKEQRERRGFYLVKSSQVPKSRYRDRLAGGEEGISYVVRLEAWNCTCASFAFSSFRSNSTITVPFRGENEKREVEWEYGGESLDGRDGGAVPVCKHLLACLLAERWSVLGGQVDVREVERDEVVGLSV